MKFIYIFVLSIVLTGCATVSEYNQGCRDGLEKSEAFTDTSWTNKFCNDLDRIRKDNEKEKESHGRP